MGFRAAEILQDMMNEGNVRHTTEFIPPTTVVERASTQVTAVEDRELARVCRFIREHACEGIDVNDVAEITSLSRRQLERRFRTELNRTPREEITSVQIARVKELLTETTMTLETNDFAYRLQPQGTSECRVQTRNRRNTGRLQTSN